MEKICIGCGMPLENEEILGGEIDEGILCKFCINEDGRMKSAQEIFDGGSQFFMNAIEGTTRELAEKITRKNMNSLEYWQDKDEKCLKGDEATEEEFNSILEKLQVLHEASQETGK